jgi:membrane protein implicated in regulation of membrane protease activity
LDALELTYVTIGVVSLALLLFTFVVGELFDFDVGVHPEGGLAHGDFEGPSLLSSRVISASLVGFAAFGYIAAAAGAYWAITLVVAFLGMALVGGGTFFAILKPLYRQEHSQTVSRDSYLGLSATVVTAIPKGGFGQVSLIDGNHTRVTQKARSQDGRALPSGESVRIVEVTPTGVTVN